MSLSKTTNTKPANKRISGIKEYDEESLG